MAFVSFNVISRVAFIIYCLRHLKATFPVDHQRVIPHCPQSFVSATYPPSEIVQEY